MKNIFKDVYGAKVNPVVSIALIATASTLVFLACASVGFADFGTNGNSVAMVTSHRFSSGQVLGETISARHISFLNGSTTPPSTFARPGNFVGGHDSTTPLSTFSNTSNTQLACVGTAVGTREQTIDTSMSTYTLALNSAYSDRASALQTAYGLTSGNSAVRTAVKAAWTTFNSAVKSARLSWQHSRNSAWSTFRSSVKACKAPSVPTDSANSNLEASGN